MPDRGRRRHGGETTPTTGARRPIWERFPGHAIPDPPAFASCDDDADLIRFGITAARPALTVARWLFGSTGLRRVSRLAAGERAHLLERSDYRVFDHPLALAASLVLRDDPRCRTVAERSTALVMGAGAVWCDLQTGAFTQDRVQGRPLDMGLYGNLFGTGLRIQGGALTMFKAWRPSRFAIACRGTLWVVDLGPPQTWDATAVRSAVEAVLDDTLERRPQPLGWASAASEPARSPLLREIERSSLSRASLRLLEQCLFTICLHPGRAPSGDAAVLGETHGPADGDRWFGSSLQLVVYGNGRAAAIANFRTWLDGNAMIRGLGEINRTSMRVRLGASGTTPPADLVALQFDPVDPAVLARACDDVAAHLRELAPPATTLPIGSNRLSAEGIAAVPAFVAALAIAGRRTSGRSLHLQQAVSCATSRASGVQFVDIGTDILRDVVDAFTIPGRTAEARVSALRALTSWHRSETSTVRASTQLRVLRMLAGRERRTALEDTVLRVLALVDWFRPPSVDVMMSHPAIDVDVPIVGRPGALMPWSRSCSVHYQIHEGHTSVCLAAGPEMTPDGPDMVAALQQAMIEVAQAVERARTAI